MRFRFDRVVLDLNFVKLTRLSKRLAQIADFISKKTFLHTRRSIVRIKLNVLTLKRIGLRG